MKQKIFGTQTGLPASELVMGGSQLGERRGYGNALEESLQILSAYTAAGGNFFDLSDLYQYGEAEEIIGKFTQNSRHNYVICTKYTTGGQPNASGVNTGNHRKAMRQAIEGSLRRLNTDYIDIYIPHFDDGLTPIEETVRGLEDLVKAGKVLYTGLANFPAWKAAAIATSLPMATVQFEYNLVQRTAERELIPMAGHFGMAMMCYSPLASGLLTGKYREGSPGRLTQSLAKAPVEDEQTKQIIDELIQVASDYSCTAGEIALAWVMKKGVFPIIGARSLAQLQTSLKAAELNLSDSTMSRLDQISAVSMGYPHELLAAVQKRY